MANQAATDRILQIVRHARTEAGAAERQFDRANSDIQWKASRSIDLFGGDATSRVADIARDARRACDDLYSAYQSLIRIVDEQCRPLLDQEPALSAVKEVRDLIKWLNDESEIENNFTASFNSRSLGDVASARYIPSMDNKMIQRYWENRYAMWPGRAEQEAREAAEAAERRRRQEEARRAAQEEERKRQEAEMAEYERQHREWKKQAQAVEEQRRSAVQRALDDQVRKMKLAADKAYEDTRKTLMADKADIARPGRPPRRQSSPRWASSPLARRASARRPSGKPRSGSPSWNSSWLPTRPGMKKSSAISAHRPTPCGQG